MSKHKIEFENGRTSHLEKMNPYELNEAENRFGSSISRVNGESMSQAENGSKTDYIRSMVGYKKPLYIYYVFDSWNGKKMTKTGTQYTGYKRNIGLLEYTHPNEHTSNFAPLNWVDKKGRRYFETHSGYFDSDESDNGSGHSSNYYFFPESQFTKDEAEKLIKAKHPSYHGFTLDKHPDLYKFGSMVPESYEGAEAEEVWNSWTSLQKEHFIYDHFPKNDYFNEYMPLDTPFHILPETLQKGIVEHIKMGQYKTDTKGVKYRAEVGATGENKWSSNAMEYDTPDEAQNWLNGLAGRWFGYNISRVVPVSTPTNQTIDTTDPLIYQNYRSKEYAKGNMIDSDNTRYPRKADDTGKGIMEGWVIGDGNAYYQTEQGALKAVKDIGYKTIEEAYDNDEIYYTDWHDEDLDEQGYYYTANGKEVQTSSKQSKVNKERADLKQRKKMVESLSKEELKNFLAKNKKNYAGGGGVGGYSTNYVNREDLYHLINLLDALDISYDLDGSNETIDFDITELDSEQQQQAKKWLGIDKMAKGGGVFTEYEIYHTPSQTILTFDKKTDLVKDVREWNGKHKTEITIDGILYRKNPIYKTFNSIDKNQLLSKQLIKKNYSFGKGGSIEKENAEMVLNNNKQISHHTEELASAVKGKSVPAWVVAKVNRSATDLSDATHYLEGTKKAKRGAKTGSKGFMVFNYTDEIYASPDIFSNKTKANEFIAQFRKRFEGQGYYRDNRMNKVAIKDIDLLAIPENFNPFK